MTQTAGQYLAQLTAMYTPSPSQFEGAKGHRSSIESRLDRNFGLREMFETGSLRHGTGVKWWSDSDYLASFKGFAPSSEWTILNKVKEALQDRFTQTEIVVRRPAVVCRFSDGDVEITPAYPAISSSGVQSGYWIPDPRGGWMQTHPKDHNAYVNEANKKHGGAAKQLARQAKIWKYKRGVPVSSCYLEMRAAKYAVGEKYWFPVWDLRNYLQSLLANNLAAMNDPTGLGSRFHATSSDSNRDDAMSKLRTAVGRAEKARTYEKDNKHAEAIGQLKLLFGQ